MATIWYVDASGNRAGPIELTQAVGLVKTGMIGPATLVWAEGMTDWAVASQAPLLAGQFAAAPPAVTPPPASPPTIVAPASAAPAIAGGALASDATAWGLFWRVIVFSFGNLLVIPAPWLGTMWWGYVGRTTRLPGGAALRFSGLPSDIWWVFVLSALLPFLGAIPFAFLITLPLSFVMQWLTVRWFVGKLETPRGALSFSGGFWGLFGYGLLVGVSFITIIGWAWALKAMIAWGCRHVQGPVRFEFRGAGLEILWRTLVVMLVSCLVVTIPWMMAWQYRWYVSQIHAEA